MPIVDRQNTCPYSVLCLVNSTVLKTWVLLSNNENRPYWSVIRRRFFTMLW